MKKFIQWLFSRNSLPYWCVFIIDSILLVLSGLFTYWLYDKTLNLFANRVYVVHTVVFYALLNVISAFSFNTYYGVIRYSSFVDLLRVAYANGLTLVLALISYLICKTVGIVDLMALTPAEICSMFLMATLLMWGFRVVIKTLYDVSFSSNNTQRILIYGALSGGVGLAKYIRSLQNRKFILKGFISHDNRAKHLRLMGEKVYNVNDDLSEIIRKNDINAVLVSPLRTEDFRSDTKTQDILIGEGCKIFMARQVKEISIEGGHLSANDYNDIQLHEVSVEDLLPRQKITMDMESVSKALHGKSILITGSAGSIGSEIVRQIASYKPQKMVLIDQAETPEHDIMLMMANEHPDIEVEVIVATIINASHMESIFRDFKPDYVFHAAAYKHVPMMEMNPSEAVLNNIYGTKIIADLSVKYGVRKFVMISTDKAVNPTNVMGCSKRICEIYVQSLNKVQSTTQFVTTRFGNVLGSNGSVIPLFREQIKKGGPVTVTDERIVRFFMLIPEACSLVLEAGTKGNGGEIFVFDMGEPVKIIDLAKRMISLSGAKDVEIQITGLREGEKLYEEVLNELEGTKPSFHEKIRIASVREYDYAIVDKDIEELVKIAKRYNNMDTVRKMKQIVPEYKSNNSVYEELDK